ncbi:hypothetical protein PtB15_14B123 [Puccinia triticina]|nr:hypothetical protein PtB15_14B123 [Puccinia triticina]
MELAGGGLPGLLRMGLVGSEHDEAVAGARRRRAAHPARRRWSTNCCSSPSRSGST